MRSALHYGYCDFAQYDGVGRARASLSSGTLLPSFPKCLSNPNAVILVVPAEPKLRHSCSNRRTQTSSFRAQSRNPSRRCQRISQRSQRPLHSTMDTATSRSMTVLVGQGRLCPLALFSRHSRSTCRIQTSSFRAQSRNPSPRYQRIRQLRNPAPSAPKPRHSPKYPLHPNFVIPRAVAESIFACQRISQRSQRPLHSTMDTATSRSMTVLVGQGRLCPLALFSRHSRSTCRTGTLSFPQCPLHPNFVILVVPAEPKLRHSPQCPLHPNFVIPRAVAESIFACQRIRQRSQCPLHSTMDTATSRSMTVLVGQGRLCPLALFSCHSRSSCRIQTPSFL